MVQRIKNAFVGVLWLGAMVFSAGQAVASDYVPTVTRVEGSAKIFSNPGKQKQGPGPHAMFEGMYYTVAEAKIKMKLENGNIIQTADKSKVRLVYPNGDLFTVSENTAFRVSLEQHAGKSDTKVDMMFGKLRTFIVNGGPRSGMQVKTKSAVMGVRGTDFAVSAFGGEEGTKLSVLRGTVAIANQPAPVAGAKPGTPPPPPPKPVEVPAGMSASVAAPPSPPPAAANGDKATAVEATKPVAIQVAKTDSHELLNIQKESTIKKAENLSAEEKKDVETLEKKAAEATIVDIKKANPDLLASADAKNLSLDNIDAIQTLTVKKLYEKAPPPKVVPPARDNGESKAQEAIEDHADEVYKKYFKLD